MEAAGDAPHHHFCRWFSDLTPAQAFARAFPGCPSAAEAAHTIDSMTPRELRVRWRLGGARVGPEGVSGAQLSVRSTRSARAAPTLCAHLSPEPGALPNPQGVFASIFGSPTTSNNTTWVRTKIKSGACGWGGARASMGGRGPGGARDCARGRRRPSCRPWWGKAVRVG